MYFFGKWNTINNLYPCIEQCLRTLEVNSFFQQNSLVTAQLYTVLQYKHCKQEALVQWIKARLQQTGSLCQF